MRDFILFISMLFLISCGKSFDSDIADPLLPGYTESGNNDAGARINNRPWMAQRTGDFYGVNYSGDIFISFFPDENYTTIKFYSGRFVDDQEYQDRVSVIFQIEGALTDLSDIRSLEGREYKLDGSETVAGLKFYDTLFSDSLDARSIKGSLFIRKCKFSSEERMVFAGTFGFDAYTEDSILYQVHSGRFDYSISDDNLRTVVE